jgi:hypothetical protein
MRQRRQTLRRAAQCREIQLSAIENHVNMGINSRSQEKRVNINGWAKEQKADQLSVDRRQCPDRERKKW